MPARLAPAPIDGQGDAGHQQGAGDEAGRQQGGENAERDGREGEEGGRLHAQHAAAKRNVVVFRRFQPRKERLREGRPRARGSGRCPRHPYPPNCVLSDLRIPANPLPESQVSVHTIANRLSRPNKPFGLINFPGYPSSTRRTISCTSADSGLVRATRCRALRALARRPLSSERQERIAPSMRAAICGLIRSSASTWSARKA